MKTKQNMNTVVEKFTKEWTKMRGVLDNGIGLDRCTFVREEKGVPCYLYKRHAQDNYAEAVYDLKRIIEWGAEVRVGEAFLDWDRCHTLEVRFSK